LDRLCDVAHSLFSSPFLCFVSSSNRWLHCHCLHPTDGHGQSSSAVDW
jgi:hypothetical protein